MALADRPFRLGLIGLGNVAVHQIAALAEVPDCFALAAVCDTDKSLSPLAPAAPFFAKADELARSGLVDAVMVSVPLHLHADVAKLVLQSGVPVLLEKPATETIAEFDALTALADERGTLLHSAFHMSFGKELEWYLAWRGKADRNHGPLTGIRSGFFDPYVIKGRLAPRVSSLGGSWVDSGINALSVIDRLVGEIRVEGLRRTRVASIPCREIQATMDYSFGVGSGGIGVIDTNWTLGRDQKITTLFFASGAGWIELDHSKQQVREIWGGATSMLCDFAPTSHRMVSHYVGVFRDFALAMRSRGDNRAKGRRLLSALLTGTE